MLYEISFSPTSGTRHVTDCHHLHRLHALHLRMSGKIKAVDPAKIQAASTRMAPLFASRKDNELFL